MRYVGIDYGTKRVGVALSDESGTLAFPHSVIGAMDAADSVSALAQKEKVDTIVLGESLDLSGKKNLVMNKIEAFKKELEGKGLRVVYENEVFTSAQASRNPRGESAPIASPASYEKKELIDSSAAALILQSYLDKQKK